MRILTALILMACLFSAQALLIPPTLLYTNGWKNSGLQNIGGIPSVTTISTTINSTGDTTDRTTAINNALAACPSNQVVLLGNGLFYTAGLINLQNLNGVVLRGSGSTTLHVTGGNGYAVRLGNGGNDYPFWRGGPSLTQDAPQWTNVVVMADTSTFNVGDHIRISINQNTNIPVVDVSNGPTNLVQMLVTTILSKTSTTLTVEDQLPFAMPVSLNPMVHFIGGGFATMCGMETISVDCSSGTPQNGVNLWSCYRCWLSNVVIYLPQNYNIQCIDAIHCQFRRLSITGISGSGNNHSGILFGYEATPQGPAGAHCLIEDCWITGAFPGLEINGGMVGMVFAYNLIQDSQSLGPQFGVGLDPNHAPHNCYNLFEGNVVSKLQNDGYYGSTSHDTINRNRVTGCNSLSQPSIDPGGSVALDLDRFTRYYNAVGNILGMSQTFWTAVNPGFTLSYEDNVSNDNGPRIYRLGFPNLGNNTYTGQVKPSTGTWWADWQGSPGPTGFQEQDLDVNTYLIRKGNWNAKDGAVPASETTGSDTVPSSYYLSSGPAWFRSLPWPPYEATAGTNSASTLANLTNSYTAIPAGYRFVFGVDPPPAGAGIQTSQIGTSSTGTSSH